MKFTKLLISIFATAVFLTACSSDQPAEVASDAPFPNENQQTENIIEPDNDFYAKDNFDLQRVGGLLEKANNAEEFEYLLNSDEGINNLDLNGDGYADYVSVAEYDDRDDNDRGFSLFSRFNGDDIQELATIIFNRDRPDRQGARVYLNGNEQIYGDNAYYEQNWLDKSLNIADWAFGNRNDNYQSPYYYDNYPDNYETYQIVETPAYRTRITNLYPDPVFTQTSFEPEIRDVIVRSPYYGKTINNIHAKLAKPTKEQREFLKNNPYQPNYPPVNNGKRKVKGNKFDREAGDFDHPNKGKKDRGEKGYKPEKFDRKDERPERGEKIEHKPEKKEHKPDKEHDKGKDKGKGHNKGKGKGKP